MSFVGDLIGDFVGGITGASQAADAATSAGNIQAQAAREGIAENRRQFDKLVELMAPFVTTGKTAIGAQGNLIGLGGAPAQTAAITALQNSPEFKALTQQGENAILANASATGGLRGGNVQAALSQFRPAVLSQLISQQFNRLGGLSQLGQASAAGQASAGLQSAGSIADLLAQAGAAQAGGTLAQGNVPRQAFGDLLSIGGVFSGAGGIPGIKGLF